jgi:hypothetical protein
VVHLSVWKIRREDSPYSMCTLFQGYIYRGFITSILSHHEAEIFFLNSFCHWLRVGRPRGRTSSKSRGKIVLFSISPRPALRPTQNPIQEVLAALYPVIKRPGCEAGHSSLRSRISGSIHTLPHTSSWCRA